VWCGELLRSIKWPHELGYAVIAKVQRCVALSLADRFCYPAIDGKSSSSLSVSALSLTDLTRTYRPRPRYSEKTLAVQALRATTMHVVGMGNIPF